MDSNIQIKIDKPCQQNWQHMTANTEGHFCSSCAKTVVDFTVLSDEQIIEFLNNNKGKLCGRFTTEQLSRPIRKSKIEGSPTNFKGALAGLLLTLVLGNTVSAKGESVKTEIVQSGDAEKDICDKDSCANAGEFKGRVIDAETGEAIPYANVTDVVSSKNLLTDELGIFSLATKIGDTLKVSYLGYYPKEFVVQSFSSDIKLTSPKLDMMMGDIVTYSPKIISRIRRFFRIRHHYY